MKKTGWELENRGHFDSIVKDYDNIRPDYPEELFSDVIALGGSRALEIGAGTGRATEPFLKAAYEVTAVEISDNMSALLKERFSTYPAFRVITSDFESAETGEGYDLIYAASAFHWVKADIGAPKALHILKPGGHIALMRYNMRGEAAMQDVIDALYDKYYYKYYPRRHAPLITQEQLASREGIRSGFRLDDLRDYGFYKTDMRFYERPMTYTADRYVELLATMSSHRLLPDEIRLPFFDEIRQAVEAHGGYTLTYTFQLYTGEK